VLYGALATGLFWISRPAGLIAWFWTLIVILAPRLFLSLHFLSDIYVGLAFGVLVMMTTIRMKPNLSRFVGLALRTEGARPSLFYAAGLLFIWQMNTAFPDVRAGLRAATKLIQRAPVQSEMSVHERLGEQAQLEIGPAHRFLIVSQGFPEAKLSF
jgi:undecaprenyl-diphosphatase